MQHNAAVLLMLDTDSDANSLDDSSQLVRGQSAAGPHDCCNDF